MSHSKKPRFNLNYILQETGLKADTIRAWERRYHLPQPARSSGGHRLYSEYDLQTILWLLKRQKEGMRIGQASAYWRELSEEDVDPLSIEQETHELPVSPLITNDSISLEDMQVKWLEYSFLFDERNAEQILSQAFAQYPVHIVCSELILPGLRKVGDLWASGKISVQQEHFTSEITSRKLQALIAAAPNPTHDQNILIGNPPGEHHTIVLMIMALLLRNRGWQVTYLGGNVPHRDLLNTINQTDIDLVIMSASRLSTSAALKDTIEILLTNGTPAAYSGWIFSQSESLNERIPGLYLGKDLAEAINIVEQFLHNPVPVPTLDQTISDERLIEKLREIEPQLSKSVLDQMMAENLEFEPDAIITASRDLLADIAASLSLGDIHYAFINLDWVSKLLANRNSSKAALQAYISIFNQSIEEILGSEANKIVLALEEYSKSEETELT